MRQPRTPFLGNDNVKELQDSVHDVEEYLQAARRIHNMFEDQACTSTAQSRDAIDATGKKALLEQREMDTQRRTASLLRRIEKSWPRFIHPFGGCLLHRASES